MGILQEVKQHGQQIWLDSLSRSLIRSGGLAEMLRQGVSGITSNPAIFEKAFASDVCYAEEVAQLKQRDLSPKARYETLAVADVQAACDVCLAEYEASGGSGGLVSLEVAPELAHDAAATVAEAKRLWALIKRPNAMIKVPATDAGLTALTFLVAEGIHVNLTLLFSRRQVQAAYAAYVEGILARLSAGGEVGGIQVVASFFISRIDAALDATLPTHLQGQTAIALAKAAYRDWQQYFSAPDWLALQQQGAQPPRLLWASTGVKNPAYPATLYVDSLIGMQTVNTVPEATLNAFLAHGKAEASLVRAVAEAETVLAEVAALGVDLEVLAARLQDDGLKQFEAAFERLLAPLA